MVSSNFFVALGGPFPGIHNTMYAPTHSAYELKINVDHCHRPQTDCGATAPIFPIVVKCKSEPDALKVVTLQKLLEGIHQATATRHQVAELFVRAPSDDHLEISGEHFYTVWIGKGVGVYCQWYVFVTVLYFMPNR
jgi:hypothetical protein